MSTYKIKNFLDSFLKELFEDTVLINTSFIQTLGINKFDSDDTFQISGAENW